MEGKSARSSPHAHALSASVSVIGVSSARSPASRNPQLSHMVLNEPPRTFVEEEHRQMDAERTPAGFRHYLRNLRKSESSPQRVRCDMFIANSGLSTGQFWSLAQAGEFCWTTCWQVFMPAGCQVGVLQALLGLRMKLAFHSTAKSRFSPSQAD